MLNVLIISILCSLLVGVISYYIAIALDSWMDYAGILHFIRLNAFKKYATDEEIEKLESFRYDPDDEKTAINQIVNYRIYRFSEVAAREPRFKLLTCDECLSIRISILLSLIASAICHFDKILSVNGFILFPIVVIFSIVVIYKLRS